MYGYKDDYISEEDMRSKLLYKRIVEVSDDLISLENGVTLSIECTESDCCAGGGGKFEYKGDALDAVITDVKVGESITEYDGDTNISTNTITIFHNQNSIVLANATTDAGNGGFYYSVTSLRIGDVYFPFVEA